MTQCRWKDLRPARAASGYPGFRTIFRINYEDSDAVAAEADFEPVDDATKYCWEQDCAYPFDDAGLSARYLDQG